MTVRTKTSRTVVSSVQQSGAVEQWSTACINISSDKLWLSKTCSLTETIYKVAPSYLQHGDIPVSVLCQLESCEETRDSPCNMRLSVWPPPPPVLLTDLQRWWRSLPVPGCPCGWEAGGVQTADRLCTHHTAGVLNTPHTPARQVWLTPTLSQGATFENTQF